MHTHTVDTSEHFHNRRISYTKRDGSGTGVQHYCLVWNKHQDGKNTSTELTKYHLLLVKLAHFSSHLL